MSRVINTKPPEQIRCFGTTCGRCGGVGEISSLDPNNPGICPVCMGSGLAQTFESRNSTGIGLPANRTFADGVQVSSTQGRGRRR